MNAEKSYKRILLAFFWYDRDLHRGIVDYARENGWVAEIIGLPYHTYHVSAPPDGIIANLGFDDRLLSTVDRFACPLVDLARNFPDRMVNRVLCDNRRVGEIAAGHFIDRNFENFLLVANFHSFASVDRFAGFCDKAAEAGLEDNVADHWFNKPPPRPGRGAPGISEKIEILGQVIADQPKPLAIFVQEDFLGTYVMEACNRHGLSVPSDVSILSCDDNELICESLPIPLSSIDTSMWRQGYEAARRLDEVLQSNDRKTETRCVPPGDVHVRQSSNIHAVEHPETRRALEIINRDFRNPLFDVNSLTERLHVSKSSLTQAFRKHLDRGVAETIRSYRLEASKEALRKGMTVADCSCYCGFSDEKTFRRAFKARYGMPPSQFPAKPGGAPA